MIDFAGLATTAAIGTSARPVALADLPEPVAAVLHPDRAEPAEVLLDAAAAIATVRVASVRSGPELTPLRLPAPSRPPAPAPVISLLRRMRASEVRSRDALQHQALTAIAARGFSLPPDLLLELLEEARTKQVARDLAGTLDDRGWALVGLDSVWSQRLARSGAASAADDPMIWEEGSLAQRDAYLRTLRRTQPESARSLLGTAEFAKETAEAREAFVRALEVGLGADDEPFLEGLLDDRAKRVRAAAAGLLAKLPGSAYLRRAEGLAAAHLQLRTRVLRAPVLIAEPIPETADTKRDCYPTSDPEKTPLERLHLLHVISILPPSRWKDLLGSAADELATGPAEYHGSPIDLSAAFAAAALSWRDSALAEAVAAGKPQLLTELWAVVPSGRRDQLASEALRHGADRRILDRVVAAPMTPRLAGTALRMITAIAGDKSQLYRIGGLVIPLAINADLAAAPELIEGLRGLESKLPEDARAARRDVVLATATLQLRQALAEVLLPYPELPTEPRSGRPT